MGFFSHNCKGCNSSIKAPYDIPKHLAWQNDAVAVGYQLVRGSYDGYGRIDDQELADEPVLWHARCFDAATPEAQADTTPSEHASDQGFFYDDDDSGKHTILG